MKTHTITTYQIDEHPNPESVYAWIRSNWYDLGDYSLEEAHDSIKGFCNHFDATLKDYSFGIVEDRSDNITIGFSDSDIEALSGVRLWKYLNNNCMTYRNQYSKKIESLLSGDCPFTGMVFDEILLDEIRVFMKQPDTRNFKELINDCTHDLLKALHSEGEYIYSDEGLRELCEGNEYEFTESGEIYS